MNSKKFMRLRDAVSSTVRRPRHCALDAQSRVNNLKRQTKSVLSLMQKGEMTTDVAYQWYAASCNTSITNKNKKTASPPRFIDAPYQPLCLKRCMNKAQWRGLFLSFTHTNRSHISTLDTVSSTVRRHHYQHHDYHHQHNQHHFRHCALDAQSRVSARVDQCKMQNFIHQINHTNHTKQGACYA